VGQTVALHSAAAGDADGWRRFDLWSGRVASREQVLQACPHDAIVGLAVVLGIDALGCGWRVRLERAQPLAPLGPIASGDLDLWPIPLRWRGRLQELVAGGSGSTAGREA
jgi:hypothetical protein